MGYLVRPSCPKCGDNTDVDEIVVHSGKKTASGELPERRLVR